MTDPSALYALLTWTSPAYPTGSFSYSHGLEYAVEAGWVTDETGLTGWIAQLLTAGAGAVDGALFAAAFRAAAADDAAALCAAADLGAAWRGSSETWLEATQPGRAFRDVTLAAWPDPRLARLDAALGDRAVVHAVSFAMAAAVRGIALDVALAAYLHGFAANLVSAGVRLIPLGQTAGQRVQAALEPAVAAAAAASLAADLDRVGTACPAADIAAMRHETQYTRLFRS